MHINWHRIFSQRTLFWYLLVAFIANAGACEYVARSAVCNPLVIASCEP